MLSVCLPNLLPPQHSHCDLHSSHSERERGKRERGPGEGILKHMHNIIYIHSSVFKNFLSNSVLCAQVLLG